MDTQEVSSEMVIDAIAIIGGHVYRFNWTVEHCRYFVLLGMPWNVANKPLLDYEIQIVKVGGLQLPRMKKEDSHIRVTNMGVKKFRSMLRKKKYQEDFFGFQLLKVQYEKKKRISDSMPGGRPEVDEIISKYHRVFGDELRKGIPLVFPRVVYFY